MPVLVLDPKRDAELRRERQVSGADQWDEMWEGVYVMAPLANNEHQVIGTAFGGVLVFAIMFPGLGQACFGVNVSDRVEDWKHNYRIPDIAVFLAGTRAIDCGTHWCGGPDFLADILSAGDAARKKFAFYAQIGVREVLLIDRDPWGLELYQLRGQELAQVGVSTLADPAWLDSAVLPLHFRLIPGKARPGIEIRHRDGRQQWVV